MDYQRYIDRNLKKITVSLAVIGVAAFAVWYMNSGRKENEPYIEQVPSVPYLDEDDAKEETLVSASQKMTKPKKKKKKIDAKARMEKLLRKQNKRHNQTGDNAPDYDDDDGDDINLDPDAKAWRELIKLLSIKGIVLRPQILYDFIALEIKSFCGSNVTITISREVNTNQSESKAKDQTISRIEGFIPIINNARYHIFNNMMDDEKEEFDEFGGYDKQKEREWNTKKSWIEDLSNIGRNELGFGIITNRASKVRSRFSLSWNILDYMIYPSFLNKYYKWNINDSLYFSTLYKDFSREAGHDDWQGNRRKIDDTYFNTGNIVNGFIVFLNKTMTRKICILQCEGDVYHTDDRIKYRNMKVPMDVDKYNDKVTLCNLIWSKPKMEDIMRVWTQSEDSDIYLLHIPHTIKGEKINVYKININVNNAEIKKYKAFGGKMDELNDKLTEEYLKKYPYDQQDVIPGFYGENDSEATDIRNSTNPLEIDDKMAIKYNEILKNNQLLNIKLVQQYINAHDGQHRVDYIYQNAGNKGNKTNKTNKITSKKKANFSLLQPLPIDFKLKSIYLDNNTENGKNTVLYFIHLGYKQYEKAKWKLFMRLNGKGVNKKNLINYNNLYQKFISLNKYILNEDCDVMFVDERILNKKKIIAIFGEYMLVLPCYNNNIQYVDDDDDDDEKSKTIDNFANIYNVKDVIADLFSVETKTSKNKYINDKTTSNVRGGKWYYSYQTQTLYVFERLSTSSKYPYRLRRILLHTFKF